MNFLHLNQPKGLWTWVADVYAVALVFLAILGPLRPQGEERSVWPGKVARRPSVSSLPIPRARLSSSGGRATAGRGVKGREPAGQAGRPRGIGTPVPPPRA